MLSQKDEFLLTLMKLHLGSTSADLAQRFGIGTTTVSNVFTAWIKILSKELGSLVYNPSKDVVKKTLPAKFKKPGYSNVRHIIDCTEIFIETPSNPTVRAATWSDYKHYNTAKVLVSTALLQMEHSTLSPRHKEAGHLMSMWQESPHFTICVSHMMRSWQIEDSQLQNIWSKALQTTHPSWKTWDRTIHKSRSQQDQENCKSENLCRTSNQALEDLSTYQEWTADIITK